MSPSSDRIAAPTNGHQTAMGDGETGGAPPAATEDSSGQTPVPAAPRRLVPVGPGRAEIPPGVPSAGQLAAGFAILAALIVIVLGRRRGPRG